MNSAVSIERKDTNYLILEGRHSCTVENQDFCFLELPCGEDAVRQAVETIYQYEIDIIEQLLNPDISPYGHDEPIGAPEVRVWNYRGPLDLRELELLTVKDPLWGHRLNETTIDDIARRLFKIIDQSQDDEQTKPQLALQ